MLAPDFEESRATLDALLAWAKQHPVVSRNEATTRFQLIDRLFFECLGWDRSECIAEEHHEGTYTDYVFGKPARRLLVEAKREGIYFELPIGFSKRYCEIRTLAQDNVDIS